MAVSELPAHLSCSPAAGFILKGEGHGLSSLLAVTGATLAKGAGPWPLLLLLTTGAGLRGEETTG